MNSARQDGLQIARDDDADAILRRAFDASPFATLIFTPDLVILDSNAVHVRLTGLPREDARGRALFEAFPKNPDSAAPDTEEVIRASVGRVLATRVPDEPPVQRHDLPAPGGGFETRYWRMVHSPICADGEVVAIRQDAWDVTASVQEAERQETLRRIAGAIAGVAFWEYDPGRDALQRTPEFDAMFGLPLPKDAAGTGGMLRPASLAPFLDLLEPADRHRIDGGIEAVLREGDGAMRQVPARVPGAAGADRGAERAPRHLVLRMEAHVRGGERPVVLGTVLDVTELHTHEAYLERLLAEKELLLGEVNHRVKNSIQLVGSILSMEARQVAGPERRRLQSAAARVQAIAAVHATLYHHTDVRTVAFGAHLTRFCAQLGDGLGAEERGIEVAVEAQDAALPVEKAVPLSLIVNELVTNAVKYAFPPDAGTPPAGAAIRVAFGPEAGEMGKTFVLSVSDNGAQMRKDGFPATDRGVSEASGTYPPARASDRHERGPAAEGSSGLGTVLVNTLARQIGGRIEIDHDDGWSTRIEFPA